MTEKILLGHGSGGKMTHQLIQEVFLSHFDNDILSVQSDAAIFPHTSNNHLAMTTDSYVVNPISFPGGDIGKLAVCGTVNDLAVSGARPLYLAASFIIEEGFPVADLITVVESMSNEAQKAGVSIVAGDTKVVNRGMCDKLFITTTGFGDLTADRHHIASGRHIHPGDVILINGPIADHGMAVLSAREGLDNNGAIQSDCTSLNHLIQTVLEAGINIRFMRDATRGGLATVMAEVARSATVGIELSEAAIPMQEPTRGLCELLGYDPLFVANEGKVVMIVDGHQKEPVLNIMQNHPDGRHTTIIGEVTHDHPGMVVLNTSIGGRRILDMLSGEQLPRIC
ncbi:hydrogenase expression/formation protein HypE [Marinilabiliaceae bacterium JC017]|nr:hydrogenase expression/formation protein HypE [Marinilabiliaceae bacterium JC017]